MACRINHSKIVKKECQHRKNEEEIWINAHSLIKYTEIPTSNYKVGGTSVKLPLISWLFTITFNFGYVHIINSVLNKCIY